MKNWSRFYTEMVDRNIGVVSAEEQERLRNACVAVAGCGGMGGLSAEQLVRLGVGQVKIADFDTFEIHNISRQAGSTFINVGTHKAAVLGRYFQEINPELRLDVFTDGVQPGNVAEFLAEVDAVIDGIDYTKFFNTVILHRAARQRGLCVVNPQAIGFGVSVLVFGPRTMTIGEYVGLPENAGEEEIAAFQIPMEKFMPYFPTYVNREVAAKAAAGQINIPNVITPQHLGTAIAVSETVMMLLGRVKEPVGPLPRVIVLDLQDRHFEIIG